MSTLDFIRGPLRLDLIKHGKNERVLKAAWEKHRAGRGRGSREPWRESEYTPHSKNNIWTETLTSPSGSFEAWINTGAMANVLSHTVPSVSPLWHLSWRTGWLYRKIHASPATIRHLEYKSLTAFLTCVPVATQRIYETDNPVGIPLYPNLTLTLGWWLFPP